MTYTNLRIAFLFHCFFHNYQTYPTAARLASLLPQSSLHTPPRIRGTADSQAADHVSCAATPARKRDTRLAAAGFRPRFSGIISINNFFLVTSVHSSGSLVLWSSLGPLVLWSAGGAGHRLCT